MLSGILGCLYKCLDVCGILPLESAAVNKSVFLVACAECTVIPQENGNTILSEYIGEILCPVERVPL